MSEQNRTHRGTWPGARPRASTNEAPRGNHRIDKRPIYARLDGVTAEACSFRRLSAPRPQRHPRDRRGHRAGAPRVEERRDPADYHVPGSLPVPPAATTSPRPSRKTRSPSSPAKPVRQDHADPEDPARPRPRRAGQDRPHAARRLAAHVLSASPMSWREDRRHVGYAIRFDDRIGRDTCVNS